MQETGRIVLGVDDGASSWVKEGGRRWGDRERMPGYGGLYMED